MNREYIAEMKRAVGRGVALLDRHFGNEWVKRIKLEKFRLDSPCCCVIGQVFGYNNSSIRTQSESNNNVFNTLGLSDVFDAEYGFDLTLKYNSGASVPWHPEYSKLVYDRLTAEWRKVIRKRKGLKANG